MSSINLEALSVSIAYVGEVACPWDDSRMGAVDQWQVKISSNAGFWTTSYYTGIGLRSKIPHAHLNNNPPQRNSLAYKQLEKRFCKPVKPTVESVLRSLASDAIASDYNFTDWCQYFGYSDDSIKALNTYKQCLEISTALKKHFDRETLEALREAAEELEG